MSFSILNILTVLKIGSKMLPMHLNIFWNNFPTKHIFDAAFVFPDCSGPVVHTTPLLTLFAGWSITLLHCIALGHSLAAFKQSLTICLQNPFYQSYCIYNNTTITTLCKNSFGCTTTRSQSSAVKAAEFECRLVETKHKYYCDVWLEKENAININSFLVDQNVSTCTSINQFSDEPVRKWWKIFKFT